MPLEREDSISESITGSENVSPLSPADHPTASASQFS